MSTAFLGLCSALVLSGYAASQSLAGQGSGDAATAQSTELQGADALKRQVRGLHDEGRYAEAITLAERELSIREKLQGPNHTDVGATLNSLALLHQQNGDYERVEPFYLRSLAIYEKARGPDHPTVATILNNLAALYELTGAFTRAELLYQRALAIREKARGPEHPDVAASLNDLATLYRASGAYTRAEPLFQRALAIREKTLGPHHPDVAASLNTLASLHQDRGEYTRAEPLFQRSLVIQEKARGPDHPIVAKSLNDLASLLEEKGDYTRAQPLYERALSIYEKAFGAAHPAVAGTLNNLAGLYITKGDYTRAEPLHQRSLASLETALGPDHPFVAVSLSNLAGLHSNKGDYTRAEPLAERSLAIHEKTYGPDHPAVATSLQNLAVLYAKKGDHARAEPLYQRALAIREAALGPDHPDVATLLTNLASLYEAMDAIPRTVEFMSRAAAVRERNVSLILATGSERQKLAYLATLAGETDATVSLHTRSEPADRQARDLSLTTILRRKGRGLDAVAEEVSSLRRRLDPDDRTLLDQLSAALAQLSVRVMRGPGNTPLQEHGRSISQLDAEIERLQSAISTRSAGFRVLAQPVTIEQVRQAMPADAALVEFVSYHPSNTRAGTKAGRYEQPRYVAYVLPHAGEPGWADLGEAAAIDADLARLRTALKCPESLGKCPEVPEVKRLARALDESVMRPVRRLLGGTTQVFLSPDGALNLVPFGALVDEQNRYLVETLSLTYLTSGRDLLRLNVISQSSQPPVVIADPLFEVPARSVAESFDRRSSDFATLRASPLPGTASEAAALGALLPQATVLTRSSATESAVKQVSRPRVLHLATHGFFLADQPEDRTVRDGAREAAGVVKVENPLLRSGLLLAGANRLQGDGGNDGVLTALEAAGLDLWGTQLVVLSACETGVGEVRNGDGVYGLRRALVLAGSESQVMSLWKVSDAATRDLMVGYYTRLMAGEGRTEALRQVQLQMLRGRERTQSGRDRGVNVSGTSAAAADSRHPFYWAGFIQSGDWRPMSGLGPRAKQSRGARPVCQSPCNTSAGSGQ